jgi:hypothetical protein
MPVYGRLAGKVGELVGRVGEAVGLGLMIEKHLNVVVGDCGEDWSEKLGLLAGLIREGKLFSMNKV